MNTMFKDVINKEGGYNRIAPCGCSLHIDPTYQISSRSYKECDIPGCPIKEKIYEARDDDEGKAYLADYARWVFDHPEEEIKDETMAINR